MDDASPSAAAQASSTVAVQKKKLCNHCNQLYNIRRGIKDHLAKCQRLLEECPDCHIQIREGRLRDHKKTCRGAYAKTPSPLAELIDRNSFDWRYHLPEEIDVVMLQRASEQRLELWDRPPVIVKTVSPEGEGQEAFAAVMRGISQHTDFQVYEKGLLALDGSNNFESRFRAASDILYQAISPSKASQQTVSYITNIWTKSIKMDIPSYLQTSRYILNDQTPVGINVTPTGTYVDLHIDLGRNGLSRCLGSCKKIWLLFPPTKKNLYYFATTTGLMGRLYRIGKELEGGLVVQTSSYEALDLPAGTLHAVFTIAGGFIGGINFSAAEDLPVMARCLSAQIPFYKHVQEHMHEDFNIYTSALLIALDMDVQHTLLVAIIRSWQELISAVPGNLLKTFQKNITHVKKVLRRLGLKGCQCGEECYGVHLVASHFTA